MRSSALAAAALLCLPLAGLCEDGILGTGIKPFKQSSSARQGDLICKPDDKPRSYGKKKGLGLSLNARNAQGDPDEVAGNVLGQLRVSWHYDWSPGKKARTDVEFIPMIFDANHVAQDVLAVQAMQPRAVLAFNEPDLGYQSGMPPKVPIELGIKSWPAIARLPQAIPIGSPAVGLWGSIDKPEQWMARFMTSAQGRVDFVAVHWYGSPDPGAFKAWIEKVYAAFCRPIWITEFGAADWDATAANPTDQETDQRYGEKVHGSKDKKPHDNNWTTEDAKKFMRDVLPWLESNPHVARYAWFTPTAGDAPAPIAMDLLWYQDREGRVRLTELGEIYAKQ